MNPSPPSALLWITHGSTDPAARDLARRLADRFQQLEPNRVTRMAFLGHTSPSPLEALDDLIRTGTGDITVAPLLLLPADHSERDLPRLKSRAERFDFGATIRFLPPLGFHVALRRWSAWQLQQAIERAVTSEGPPGGMIHFVLGRGGRRADLRSQLRSFFDAPTDVPLPPVSTRVALLTDPEWTAMLRDCVGVDWKTPGCSPRAEEWEPRRRAWLHAPRAGNRRVATGSRPLCVVQTHLLFPGTLSRRVQRELDTVRAKFPDEVARCELIPALITREQLDRFCLDVLVPYLARPRE